MMTQYDNCEKSVKYWQPLRYCMIVEHMFSFCNSNTDKNSPQTDIKLYEWHHAQVV